MNLDDFLKPDTAAKWLGISEQDLSRKYRQGKIPGIKLGHRTVRYHPRTVITKLAMDSGVSPKVIATMFSDPH